MGIFSRLSDIINSNINAMLDTAEDPEKIVRLIIQEMEDTLVEVRSSAARCIADQKQLGRRADFCQEELAQWQRKAALAVEKGRDDLARAALIEHAKLEDALSTIERESQRVDELLAKYTDDIGKLQTKLNDAKARQASMAQRQRSAGTRVKVQKHLHDGRVDDAMIRFDHYERRIDDLEGLAEAQGLGREKSLSDEFAALEQEERIKRELDALKARIKSATKNK